jgi:predicted transcriptional regulator/transcriptional regulator with XRE-family HTH domain
MAQKAWLGNKVRRLRRDQGLAQVEMARRLGISPSYLNLIEHNQRPLTLPLLLKLGQEFNVDLRSFSDNEDARLMAELTELLGEQVFREHDIGREDLKQLVATSPSACHALLSLFRGYRSAREDVRALAERVSEDTYLATSMHELRQLLATIRSFSEILHDYADLDDAQRQQIHEILVTESEKVTTHLDQMRLLKPDNELKAPDGAASGMQEINDFIHDQRNHFPTLEEAAERIWRDQHLTAESLAFQIPALLFDLHGISVEVKAGAETDRGLAHFDEQARSLRLSPLLPAASRGFQAARHLGGLACETEIEAILDDSRLKDPELRLLAAGLLARYFAGALLMPYGDLLSAARASRYDLDLLSQQFQASFEQVCHRLTTLQRPGAEAIPFHFLRVDIAGNISKRYSASGFPIPQYGNACPRWNVHTAFLTPGRIDAKVMTLPDGSSYFMIARSVTKPAGSYHEPQTHYSIALGCETSRAREFVYSDGLDLDNPDVAVPVGITCRLCERHNCPQRAFPPVLQSLASESLRISDKQSAARN